MKNHLLLLVILSLPACKWFSTSSGDVIQPNVEAVAGHSGDVLSLAASADGKYLLSGGYDQTARIWEVAARKEVRRFEGLTGAVTAVAFSPDGLKVGIGGENGSLCVWKIQESSPELCFKEQKKGILSLNFSPDGKNIATGGEDKTLRIYDLEQKRQIRATQAHEDMVESVQFAPDGKSVLSAGLDRKACIWGAATLSVRCVQRKWGEIWSAAFSADGAKFVTGGNDFAMVLWQKNAAEPAVEINQGQAVESVLFSLDGQTLIGGNRGGDIKTWSLGGNPKKELKGHVGTVWAMAQISSTKELASAGADGTIRLWNLETGNMTAQFGSPQKAVEFVGFAADRILSWSENQPLNSWSENGVNSKKLNLANERQRFISFSADGKQALTHNERLFVHLWNTETGRKLKTLSGFPYPVQNAIFSADGSKIAVGISDGRIQLFDGSGNPGLTLIGQEKSAESLAFSADDSKLFSGDLDGFISTWDIASGDFEGRVKIHKSAVSSLASFEDGFVSGSRDSSISFNGSQTFKLADEALVVSGNGDAVAVNDVLGNAYICTSASDCKAVLGGVYRISLSPSADYFATAARDGQVKIYDINGNQQFRLLQPASNVKLILGQNQQYEGFGAFKKWIYRTENLVSAPLLADQNPEKGLLGSLF